MQPYNTASLAKRILNSTTLLSNFTHIKKHLDGNYAIYSSQLNVRKILEN